MITEEEKTLEEEHYNQKLESFCKVTERSNSSNFLGDNSVDQLLSLYIAASIQRGDFIRGNQGNQFTPMSGEPVFGYNPSNLKNFIVFHETKMPSQSGDQIIEQSLRAYKKQLNSMEEDIAEIFTLAFSFNVAYLKGSHYITCIVKLYRDKKKEEMQETLCFRRAEVMIADSNNNQQEAYVELSIIQTLLTRLENFGIERPKVEHLNVMYQIENTCGDCAAYNAASLAIYSHAAGIEKEPINLRACIFESQLSPYYGEVNLNDEGFCYDRINCILTLLSYCETRKTYFLSAILSKIKQLKEDECITAPEKLSQIMVYLSEAEKNCSRGHLKNTLQECLQGLEGDIVSANNTESSCSIM